LGYKVKIFTNKWIVDTIRLRFSRSPKLQF